MCIPEYVSGSETRKHTGPMREKNTIKTYDIYENKEEHVEERDDKTWRLNKRSMTNEDVDEEITRKKES